MAEQRNQNSLDPCWHFWAVRQLSIRQTSYWDNSVSLWFKPLSIWVSRYMYPIWHKGQRQIGTGCRIKVTWKSHEWDQMRSRDRPVKDPEGSRRQSSVVSPGQGMISQHFLGYLPYQQMPEPAAPTALILFQMSLTSDYPTLAQKEPLPFTATELKESGVLTYCNLGQRREANVPGNDISFSFSPILKKWLESLQL